MEYETGQSFGKPTYIGEVTGNILPNRRRGEQSISPYPTTPVSPVPQGYQGISMGYEQAQVYLQQSFAPELYGGTVYQQIPQKPDYQQELVIYGLNQPKPSKYESFVYSVSTNLGGTVSFLEDKKITSTYNASQDLLGGFRTSFWSGAKAGFPELFTGIEENKKFLSSQGIQIFTARTLMAFPKMIEGTKQTYISGSIYEKSEATLFIGATALSYAPNPIVKTISGYVAGLFGAKYILEGVKNQGVVLTSADILGTAPVFIGGEYAVKGYVIPFARNIYMETGTAFSVFEKATTDMWTNKRAQVSMYGRMKAREVPATDFYTQEMIDKTLAGENFFQEAPPIRGQKARFEYIKGLLEDTRITRKVAPYERRTPLIDIEPRLTPEQTSTPLKMDKALSEISGGDYLVGAPDYYGKDLTNVRGYKASSVRGVHTAPDLLQSLVITAGKKSSALYLAVKGRGQLYFAFLETKFPSLSFSLEGGRTAKVPIVYDIGAKGLEKLPSSVKADASFQAIEKFAPKSKKGYFYASPDFLKGKGEEQVLLLSGNKIALNLKTSIGKRMGFERFTKVGRFDIGVVTGRVLSKGERAFRGERVVTTDEFVRLQRESSEAFASSGTVNVGLRNIFSLSSYSAKPKTDVVFSQVSKAKSSVDVVSRARSFSFFSSFGGVRKSSPSYYGGRSGFVSYAPSRSDNTYSVISSASKSSIGNKSYGGKASYGTSEYSPSSGATSYMRGDETYKSIERASYDYPQERGRGYEYPREGGYGEAIYGDYSGRETGYKGSSYYGRSERGRTPKIPPSEKFYYPPDSEEKRKRKSGFETFVKVKGKFQKVSKGALAFSKALKLGEKVTDETVARTFAVKPVGSSKIVNVEGFLNKKFRPSKSKKLEGVGVEKSKYAIDTSGEFRGITVKGWKAKRNKRRK